jgi:hypothetical protein
MRTPVALPAYRMESTMQTQTTSFDERKAEETKRIHQPEDRLQGPRIGLDGQMQDYRTYFVGPDGHVQNRVDLRCADDDEAIRLAKQLFDGRDVELWQLDRKIGTFRDTSNSSGC